MNIQLSTIDTISGVRTQSAQIPTEEKPIFVIATPCAHIFFSMESREEFLISARDVLSTENVLFYCSKSHLSQLIKNLQEIEARMSDDSHEAKDPATPFEL